MARLKILGDDGQHRLIPIDPGAPLRVGRSPENDLVLGDDQVARCVGVYRLHAEGVRFVVLERFLEHGVRLHVTRPVLAAHGGHDLQVPGQQVQHHAAEG